MHGADLMSGQLLMGKAIHFSHSVLFNSCAFNDIIRINCRILISTFAEEWETPISTAILIISYLVFLQTKD